MSKGGSLNKVMIIGNLGADPELRSLPNGSAVANFSVATTESWVDKNSQERTEQTEWHRVTFFGRSAEILHEYGRKGGKIYIEGSLHTRKWKDKEGNDRYSTEVRGRDFTFLSSRSSSGDSSSYQNQQGQGGGDYSQSGNRGGGDDMEDDGIPF